MLNTDILEQTVATYRQIYDDLLLSWSELVDAEATAQSPETEATFAYLKAWTWAMAETYRLKAATILPAVCGCKPNPDCQHCGGEGVITELKTWRGIEHEVLCPECYPRRSPASDRFRHRCIKCQDTGFVAHTAPGQLWYAERCSVCEVDEFPEDYSLIGCGSGGSTY